MLAGALLATVACSGGGGGGGISPATPVVSPIPSPSAGGTSSSQTATVSAAQSPSTVAITGVGGYSGSLILPAVQGTGSIQLTISTQAPASASLAHVRMVRRTKASRVTSARKRDDASSQALQGLLYFTLTPQNAIVLEDLPGFALQVPSATSLLATNFYMASLLDASDVATGPATVNGNTLSLQTGLGAGNFAIGAGQSATFAVIGAGISAISLALSEPLTIGVPTTANVSVNASDTFEDAISGPLPQALSVSDSDTSGRTVLKASSITSTTQTLALAYSGRGVPFTLTGTYGAISGSTIFATTLPQEVPITGVPPVEDIQLQVVLRQMILGPGGNFWSQYENTNTHNGVAYATPSGALTFYPDPSMYHWPESHLIAEDGSGNVWIDYYDASSSRIGLDEVTPSGQFTSYGLPSSSFLNASSITSLVRGADGAIWFAFSSGEAGSPQSLGIGRIDDSGNISDIAYVSAPPSNLIVGPDGNFWFASGAVIDRMTPSGTITTFTLPGANTNTQPSIRFVVGPDGNFWAPYAYGGSTLLVFSTNGSVVSNNPLAYDPVWDFPISAGNSPLVDDIETDGKNVYVADVTAQGIIRIDPSGAESEHPTFATLQNIIEGNPINLAFDGSGTLYFASTAITSSMQSGYLGALTPLSPADW